MMRQYYGSPPETPTVPGLGLHQHGGRPGAAFRRLRDQNLAEVEVSGWHEIVFSFSHPSLGDRIAALEASA